MMLTGENILLVMVVFTAATMAQSKATKRCSHFEITVVHDGNSTCVPCELCPPGQGLSVNCGATTNVFPKCVSCQEGKTFNNGKSYFQCSTCVPCGENQLIIGKCTIYNNTQCGGCRNGYYSEDSIYDCLPCSKCCGPPDAAFIAEKCKNDGLPANHQCRIDDKRCHLYPSGTKKPGDMKLSSPTSPSHLRSTPPEHLSSTKSTHPGYSAPSFPKPSSKQTSSKENKAKSDVSQIRLVTKKQKNEYVVVVTNPLTWVLVVVAYSIGYILEKKWTFSSVKKIGKKDIFPWIT
ncbi:uncharacterized protein LOC5509243 [Nematostella vectensis]|uniref:uncharacterized protein LOC5509243 n=1 Tax=Nematostella vectensis TaxID=45351 RepID=UPI0013900F4E|nr:uncharacterized protein LOC5509243 [Nematostella vectensis]